MARLPDPPGGTGPTFDPTYVVIFHAVRPAGPYEQVVALNALHAAKGTYPHGFDREMVPLLPAMWFALGLPRTLLDTVAVPGAVLLKMLAFQNPHDIQPLPSWSLADPEIIDRFRAEVTLVIAPDESFTEAVEFARDVQAPLRVARYSELDEAQRRRTWAGVAALYNTNRRRMVLPPELPTDAAARCAGISRAYVARQIGLPQNPPELTAEPVEASLHVRALLATAVTLQEEGRSAEEGRSVFGATMREIAPTVRVPVVLGCTGVPHAFARAIASRKHRTDADVAVERDALRWLISHRAAAINGIGLELPPARGEAFRLLNALETHLSGKSINPKFVWRTLRKLGRHLAKQLGENGQLLASKASSVTAFADVPLGLAMVPGDTDPLACRVPVAQRPMTPLTKAVQVECFKAPICYFKEGFSLLVAECVDQADPIRPFSDAGWRVLAQTVGSIPRAECDVIDAASADDVRAALERRRYDALMLSAHGYYDKRHNSAGIIIGGRRVMGPELGHVPPLVMLSACHTAPRGIGAVTITDLLLARGALAVLTTLVPVDVQRNALLMNRLFVYIKEAIEGSGRFRSFDEAWQFTAATNAVHEVVSASRRMRRWAETGDPATDIVAEFKRRRSVGRLRFGRVYQDTEALLEEMADERGFGDVFRATMRSQGYLPESLFYVLVGRPERILLHDATAEAMRAKAGDETAAAPPDA